ncbi:protein MODIFIED TRANSPORT TO THE VACUOLE 1-like [Mangifera indica]|uniref:protein MODIFIED TRANSPORT TO THE VACUOLE 1-like n=1 Tax=Mangifera indica TaxID=29780 RepID=UPI001CFAC9B9|nr:protein MODIFIED TRANSPORT TO THE VACUOLE 1-like [Mangifera indica]
MDSSRRAVESYWRSRMIDGATSDEDKVTPVYKLEEICELLRSAHVSIVKEVSGFILKRLGHKSPVVKQKALRLIKYAVGKSGVEFRREMQRHSAAVRELFHYKGKLDPLKGDALNKAVRDTAHETISAIFSEENKPAPAPAEDLNKRIQGFGNTNFDMSSEDRKSFLSEVVGIGSASIKQGITSFTQGYSLKKNDNGSYRSPNLQRSLTIENEYQDKYEPVELHNETQAGFGISKNDGGPWNQESGVVKEDRLNGDSRSKTCEEKLLETIVTSGGIRLQPTRDAIQVFLVEAAKLDALALSWALESKLQSPLWQVRMKAICVLESILRKKDDENFLTIASYFSEKKDVVIRCSELPQTSLREKANKVLSLLGGEQAGGFVGGSDTSMKAETSAAVQMPDLIDTCYSDDYNGTDNSRKISSDQGIENLTSPASLIDDLFGESSGAGASSTEQNNDDDPFADVSFHTNKGRENAEDLFSGMTVDDKPVLNENLGIADIKGPELFDIFGSNSEVLSKQENTKIDVNDLMAGLSIKENLSNSGQEGASSVAQSEHIFSDMSSQSSHRTSDNAFSNLLGAQTAGVTTNPAFPFGAMPYNIPPGMMFNLAIASQPISYGAMGSLFAQQQFLATMSNLQQLGNLNARNAGGSNVTGTNQGYSSPLLDIFQPNFAAPSSSSINSLKKEETRAFDFISDHLAAACDPKRVS